MAAKACLILTDVFGATPSNIARKLVRPGVIETIAGVNSADAAARAHLS